MDFTETNEFPRLSRIHFFSDDYGETVSLILNVKRLRKPRLFITKTPVPGLERDSSPSVDLIHGSYFRNQATKSIEVLLHGASDGGMTGRAAIIVQLLEVIVVSVVLNVQASDFEWRTCLNLTATSLNVSLDRIQLFDLQTLPPLNVDDGLSRRLSMKDRSVLTMEIAEEGALPTEEEFGVVRDSPGTFNVSEGAKLAPPVTALLDASERMRKLAFEMMAREDMRKDCFSMGRARCVVPVDTGYPVLGFEVVSMPPLYAPPVNRKSCGVDAETGIFSCWCWPGWYGFSCDKQCNCPGIGMSHCNEGPQGDGKCNCKLNYEGNNCNRCTRGWFLPESGCNVCCTRETNCSSHGACVFDNSTGLPNGMCTCDTGFKYAQNFWTGQFVACAFCEDNYYPAGVCHRFCTREGRCTNRGRCDKNGDCICDEKFAGWNCESCAKDWYPSGKCDVICNTDICSLPSRCDKQGICNCEPGFFGPTCSLECPACSEAGSWGCLDGRDGPGLCDCKPGFGGKLCTQNITWTPTEWTTCLGVCGETQGIKIRQAFCKNQVTGTATVAEMCVGDQPPIWDYCVTSKCACTAPTRQQGMNFEKTLAACPFVQSGDSCSLFCIGGYVDFGRYECLGTHFVQEPVCIPVGVAGRGYKAVYSVLTMGDFTEWALNNLTHYVGIVTEALPEALLDASRAVGADYTTVKDFYFGEHQEITLMGGIATGARRLALTRPNTETIVEIPIRIKMQNSSELDLVMGAMHVAALNSTRLKGLIANNILKRCDGFTPMLTELRCPAPGRISFLEPIETQIFLQDPVGLPPKPEPIAPEPDVVKPIASAGMGMVAAFAVIGMLVVLLVLGICLRWWLRQHRRRAKVAAKDTSPVCAALPAPSVINPFCLGPGNMAIEGPRPEALALPAPAVAAIVDVPAGREDSTALVPDRADPTREGHQALAIRSTGGSSRQNPSAQISQLRSLQGSTPEQPSLSTLALLSLAAPDESEEYKEHVREAWEAACTVEPEEEKEGFLQREFPDGSLFVGILKEGQPEGWGRMTWPGGQIYMGEWLHGQPQGHGLMVSAGSARWVYNGQFRAGKRHGNGRCEWTDRKKWYDGDWTDGWQHGIGEYGGQNLKTQFFEFAEDERKGSLALTDVEPAADEIMPTVILDRKYFDKDKTSCPQDVFNDGDIEVELTNWGFAVGHPSHWFSSKFGALMVTRILEEGPLKNFHDGQRGEDPALIIKVVPNTFIWKVENVQDDPEAMLRLLCNESRRKVSFQIRKPPFTRCEGIRKNLHKRRPFAQPTPLADLGWRPWIEEAAQKQEHEQAMLEECVLQEARERATLSNSDWDDSKALALLENSSFELLPAGQSQHSFFGGHSWQTNVGTAAAEQGAASTTAPGGGRQLGMDFGVSDAQLPSLARLPGGVPPPEKRLVAAIRVQARSSGSGEAHPQQQQQLQQQRQEPAPQKLHPLLARQQARLVAGHSEQSLARAARSLSNPPGQPGGSGLAQYVAQRRAMGAFGSPGSPSAGQPRASSVPREEPR